MTQSHHFPFLEDSKEPPLETKGDFGDLIQKNRSVMG